jgi:hypothetical protein
MTATINWNLISSYYSFTEWADDGFSMTARSPWSGFYEVQPPLWAAAHTTQFAVPGDVCLANTSGSGVLPGGGSYVTYYGKDTGDVSIVIEKVSCCRSISTPHMCINTRACIHTCSCSSCDRHLLNAARKGCAPFFFSLFFFRLKIK